MTIQVNGTTLVENVAVPIQYDLQAIYWRRREEVIIAFIQGRGCELPFLNVSGLDGLTMKYARFGEAVTAGVWHAPTGPVFIDRRRYVIRRFTPLPAPLSVPIDHPDPAPTAGLYSSPMGIVRGLEPIGYGITGSQGIDPHQTPDELRADLIIERSPIACRESEPIEAYYRLVPTESKVGQLDWYCNPIPGSTNPDARYPVNLNTPTAFFTATLQSWREEDGQHILRTYRFCNPNDPAHALFMKLLARNAGFAWNDGITHQYLSTVAHRGSDVGREVAEVLELAVRVREPVLARRLKSIIDHVALPNGITQAGPFLDPKTGAENPIGFNPSPWRQCGVPQDVRVMQDLEAALIIYAEQRCGMNALAARLAQTVYIDALKAPGSQPLKWIDSDKGTYVGTYSQNIDHPWIGLAAGVRAAQALDENPMPFLAAFKRFRVPKPITQGGAVGPFDDFGKIRTALIDAKQPGKLKDAIQVLEELT